MDKEYIRRVVSLYEAVGVGDSEEVVPQEQIADSGSDVNPEEENVQAEQPSDENYENYDGMPAEDPSNTMTSTDILLSQKKLKIYNLFEKLLNYATITMETLNHVNLEMLELETFKIFNKYKRNIDELIDKINDCMRRILNKEEYEKILYIYVLFRTELLTNIKGIRDILELNNEK